MIFLLLGEQMDLKTLKCHFWISFLVPITFYGEYIPGYTIIFYNIVTATRYDLPFARRAYAFVEQVFHGIFISS